MIYSTKMYYNIMVLAQPTRLPTDNNDTGSLTVD